MIMSFITALKESRFTSLAGTYKDSFRDLKFWMLGLPVLVVASVLCVLYPVSVSYDASFGLLTWMSMHKGAAFNHLRMASIADLRVDQDVFWAAHSPGQYVLPAILHTAGISIGKCLSILQVTGMFLGLWGYFRLFTKIFKFPEGIAAISCALILMNRQALHQFLSYSGGPLLMFAGFPYLLISSAYLLEKRKAYLLLLPLVFLSAAFLKLSFTIVALGLVAASVSVHMFRLKSSTFRIIAKEIVLDLTAFCAFYLLMYYLFTSKGWTASHPAFGQTLSESLVFILYSVASIFSGVISLFWSLARLGGPFHFNTNLYQDLTGEWLFVLVGVAVASSFHLFVTLNNNPQPKYRLILSALTLTHVVLVTGLFLGKTLIAEDRHFLPISILLVPGIVLYYKTQSKYLYRLLVASVFVIFSFYSIFSYVINLDRILKGARSERLGISFPQASQKLVTSIETIDAELRRERNVFVFTDPSLALLIEHNAILVIQPGQAFKAQTLGRADRLIVVANLKTADVKALSKIVNSFPDHSNWQVVGLDDYLIVYSGGQAPPSLFPVLKELRFQ